MRSTKSRATGMGPVAQMSTNHYLILRILENLPSTVQGAKAHQIADIITELNRFWVVSKFSAATHLGYLRQYGLVDFNKIYDKTKKPFRKGGYTYYPYHTIWFITQRGNDVLANPEIVRELVFKRSGKKIAGRDYWRR